MLQIMQNCFASLASWVSNVNYNASSNTMKMVAASSAEMREQITNQEGISHSIATFNVYFNIYT